MTKFGLFNLRWYEEFGAHATLSGQEIVFSFAVACDPDCLRDLLKRRIRVLILSIDVRNGVH
ncbi:MAG TPA: hypothetical protein VMF50_00460 [Candidatus Binataceae bacterium]|nr:hypothetical protein [Candidatus Binataceae bacterium]